MKIFYGNQFVWIPVDKIGTSGEETTGEVSYNKWTENGYWYNDGNITDGTIPVTSELNQINNYEGFYVARYEAGIDTLISVQWTDPNLPVDGSVRPVSKKNRSVWGYVNYLEAETIANSMYNTSSVKSGLLTGKMWDTMLDYLIEHGGRTVSEVEVNSNTFGNYLDFTGTATHGNLQITGFTDEWEVGNIYDIAGNAYEATSEMYNTLYVSRGADCWNNGSTSAATRYSFTLTAKNISNSFRVALFIE